MSSQTSNLHLSNLPGSPELPNENDMYKSEAYVTVTGFTSNVWSTPSWV